MVKPLSVVHRNALSHVASLERIVRRQTGLGDDVALDADWDQEVVAINMVGPGSEQVRRNRGSLAQVVPLIRITRGMWAWLGLYEEWRFDRNVAGARAYAFRSLSMTIHFGLKSDILKPQIFRAEWSGFGVWAGTDASFQGKNAGHPHWQFDVLESLSSDKAETNANELLELLRLDEGSEPVQPAEFMPTGDQQVIADIVSAQKLSRLHFASAASWWRPAPHDAHAHSPERAEQAAVWLDRTIAYTKGELERLQTRQ